jgi:hypothetical protein
LRIRQDDWTALSAAWNSRRDPRTARIARLILTTGGSRPNLFYRTRHSGNSGGVAE